MDVRRPEQGNETEVLVQWKDLPAFESTSKLVATLMEKFLDFNLEDNVSSLPGSIDILRVPLAFMMKHGRTSGRKARVWEKRNESKSG